MKFDCSSIVRVSGCVLAVGAPNVTSDRRKVMCAIVLTQQLGLIRIYPFAWNDRVKQWALVTVAVRKSNKDTRLESFRVVADSLSVIGSVADREHRHRMLEQCEHRGTDDPIQAMNKLCRSIVVVRVSGCCGTKLVPRETAPLNGDDDDPWLIPQKAYPLKPYLEWRSEAGVNHSTHICALEFYYGMQRFVEHPHRVFENAHIGDPDWSHWLVLGNMNAHRNIWVAAAIHRQKKTPVATALNFEADSGPFDGWPYCTPAAVAANVVDLQRRLFTIEDT
jgi:hypothetical protein